MLGRINTVSSGPESRLQSLQSRGRGQHKGTSSVLTSDLSLNPCRKLHQQFEIYKDQVKKLGEEPQAAQTTRAESPTCGICHKTKFADGCGRACCYCQSRFCARCGGRVPLRANKVCEFKGLVFVPEHVSRPTEDLSYFVSLET